jgi:hypothetical protein
MKRPPKDPTGIATVLSIRLSPGHLAKLDALRGDRSRTKAIRDLIDGDDPPKDIDIPAPPKKRVSTAKERVAAEAPCPTTGRPHRIRQVPVSGSRSIFETKCLDCGGRP